MKKHGTISRKSFVKNSAFALAGLASVGRKESEKEELLFRNTAIKRNYKLKNVLLETGFIYDGNDFIHTKTDLFTIGIKDGKIVSIEKNDPDLKDAVNARGYLMLPSFRDMHIHIDKTFYGDGWQATRRPGNGIKGMIALEQKILPDLLKNSTYKAEKCIELLHSYGTSHIRNQTNIEPTSGLKSLEHYLKALDNKKDSFSSEIVLFPQHGVFYTNTAPLLKEAAGMDVVDFIGGVDPYYIDGSIEKTIDFSVQLALDNKKGIDIHTHRTDEHALAMLHYVIDKVNENPSLKGKSWFSHCFILGAIDSKMQEEMAEKLANAGIGINSTVPIGRLIMPIPTLYKYGVKVQTGTDSIMDHWGSFGSGNMLEKANLLAQIYGYRTESELGRCLRIATGDILPLDEKGNRQWPKVGDEANLVFLDATCSAEAVARISKVKGLVHEGNMVQDQEWIG